MHTPMCRKEEATQTESETRSASQQQVWNPDSHDDSDSEDSQPLCNLAADSIPLGQLVAKRTSFKLLPQGRFPSMLWKRLCKMTGV